jgi:hypothetical protein
MRIANDNCAAQLADCGSHDAAIRAMSSTIPDDDLR